MEVRLRDVPEQHVVTEERSVDQAQLMEWLPGAMSRVAQAANGAGGLPGTRSWPYLERSEHPDEPVFIVIYEGNPNEGPTPIEVCAPVRSADAAARTIPAHREAYVRVTKGLVLSGQIGGVYEGIEKWISAEGLQVARAPRETYWTDFFKAAEGDEVFDVAFPVS
jgi:hypothetical protein